MDLHAGILRAADCIYAVFIQHDTILARFFKFVNSRSDIDQFYSFLIHLSFVFSSKKEPPVSGQLFQRQYYSRMSLTSLYRS